MIPILLLNMLIAMMGNTYGIVIEAAEKEFLKAWAKARNYQTLPLSFVNPTKEKDQNEMR